MDFVGTVWALLPPVIAIVLALITKEVYMSLFIGVVTGALLYTNFSPVGTIEAIFEVMMEKLGDSWNVGILIFLVFLGIIVALMTRAGGSFSPISMPLTENGQAVRSRPDPAHCFPHLRSVS